MGQAKARQAEIKALKEKSAKTGNFGVLDLMFKLGDGEFAETQRNAILLQIVQTMKQNLAPITANARMKKTTKAEGIYIGVDRNDMTKIADYHISVENDKFVEAIYAFERACLLAPKAKLLELGMMASYDTKTVAPFMAFMNPECNIVITKWAHGTIIRFFDNTGVSNKQASGNLEEDAKMFADLAGSW